MPTMKVDIEKLTVELRRTKNVTTDQVKKEVVRRGYRVSNELSNATQFILTGKRHGRIYRRGKKIHIASAPGEPPAVDSGALRLSYGRNVTDISYEGVRMVVDSAVKSNLKYAAALDEGRKDGHIAPRPYAQRSLDRAWPKVQKIYKEPFFG